MREKTAVVSITRHCHAKFSRATCIICAPWKLGEIDNDCAEQCKITPLNGDCFQRL